MFFPQSTTYRHSVDSSGLSPSLACGLLENGDLGLSIFVFQVQGLALKGAQGTQMDQCRQGCARDPPVRGECDLVAMELREPFVHLLFSKGTNHSELTAFGHPASRVCRLQEHGCRANPEMAETHFQLCRNLSALFSQAGKLLRNIEELPSFCPWQI